MIPTASRIVFDRYAVDLETRELSCKGQRVGLQEKPFRLLLALLERPGQVVARAALSDALWPADVYVDREAGLNTAVRKLRSALRESSGGDCELLETVPRIGYRLHVSGPPDQPVRSDPPPGALAEPSSAGLRTLAPVLGLVFAALLAGLGLARLGRGPDTSPEPMPQSSELRARYVEARSLLGTMGGDFSRARELLRSLVGDAPEFAPAHAYLAEASARLTMRTAAPADLDEARRAARRALELDPGSAVAHRVLAMVALSFDWDVRTAGGRLQRALELGPGDPVNHLAHAAFQSALGRHGEAIAAVRQAVDLEPDSMAIRSDAGHFLLRAGRFREAAAECKMVLRLDSDNPFARDCLLEAYSASGAVDAARPHAIHLLELSGASDAEIEKASTASDPRRIYLSWRLEQLLAQPDRSAVWIATYYLALGDEDGALTWLEEAARERAPLLIFVPEDAGFSRLRGDPRYRAILQQAGLEAFTADA